jgi:hypothetical protein
MTLFFFGTILFCYLIAWCGMVQQHVDLHKLKKMYFVLPVLSRLSLGCGAGALHHLPVELV